MASMSAKALEQRALALHDRLGGQRAEVAEAEDRRAVRDHGHEVALVGVVVGERGFCAMACTGTATPGE